MKPIKCLIVDDEPLAGKLIKKHLEHFPQFELVATCWNVMDAFAHLKSDQIDLIFLDIQMPVMTGMDFVKSLKNPPDIIFITAYRDYAAESYELDVVDYLVKPITIDRFFKAINKYLNSLALKEQPEASQKLSPNTQNPEETGDRFIYVNANRKYVKIIFQEILYIESLKDYVRIHSLHGKTTTKDKISAFEQKLPDYFLRIHRSFIVNTQQITAFTNHDIEIGAIEIPIGISYKQQVFARLQGG